MGNNTRLLGLGALLGALAAWALRQKRQDPPPEGIWKDAIPSNDSSSQPSG